MDEDQLHGVAIRLGDDACNKRARALSCLNHDILEHLAANEAVRVAGLNSSAVRPRRR